jgi:hypothetical protein
MWKGITGTEIIARVIKGDIKRPRELVADVDERLEAICMKALAHDPSGRYATAADFQSALEDHLRARSILILSRDVGQYVGDLAVESRSRIRAAVEAQLAKTSEQTSADIPVLWLTAPEASRSGEVPPHTTTSSNAHQVSGAAPTEAFEPKRRSQRILLGAAGLMLLVLCFAGIAFWPGRTSPAAAIAAQPLMTPPLPTALPMVPSVEVVPAPPGTVSVAPAASSAPAGLVANAQPPGAGAHGYYRVAPKASTTIVPSANTASTRPRTGSDLESIGGRE